MADHKANLRSGPGSSDPAWTNIVVSDIAPVAIGGGWSLHYISGAQPANEASSLGNWPTAGAAAWVDDQTTATSGHRVPAAPTWVQMQITGPANTTFTLKGYSNGASGRFVEWRLNGGASQNIEEGTNDSVVEFTGTTDANGDALLEYREGAGSSSTGYANAIMITPGAASDTTPPIYEVAPAVTETRENGHTISSTADEDSVFYGVRLPAGATVPTSQQVIDGQDASGSPALEADSVAASAGISADLDFVTASASTGYRYAIVAVDDEPTPNVQATPTVIDDTTSAAVVEGISAQTIRDKAGDLTPNATNLKIAVRASSDPESVVHFSTTTGSLNGSSQTAAINLESAGVTVGDTVHFSYFNPALNEGLNVDLTVEDIA
jgi:hypothetical protein